jgi:hypothetical protein
VSAISSIVLGTFLGAVDSDDFGKVILVLFGRSP